MVHVSLTFLSEWCEFPSAPFLVRKKNLMTARVSMLLKSRASPDLLPFRLCNKKRLVIPSYDIGKSVGLRTYNHHVVVTIMQTL